MALAQRLAEIDDRLSKLDLALTRAPARFLPADS
jgi:hypothetical protein